MSPPRTYDVDRPRSGVHVNPRRRVTQTREEFDAQDKAAKRAGMSWSAWVSAILQIAAPVARRSK